MANAAIKPDKLIGGWNLNGQAGTKPTLNPELIEDPGDAEVYRKAYMDTYRTEENNAVMAPNAAMNAAALSGEYALKVKYGYANPKTVTSSDYASNVQRGIDELEKYQQEHAAQHPANQGPADAAFAAAMQERLEREQRDRDDAATGAGARVQQIVAEKELERYISDGTLDRVQNPQLRADAERSLGDLRQNNQEGNRLSQDGMRGVWDVIEALRDQGKSETYRNEGPAEWSLIKPAENEEQQPAQMQGDTSSKNIWRTIQAMERYQEEAGGLAPGEQESINQDRALLEAYLRGEASSTGARNDVVRVLQAWKDDTTNVTRQELENRMLQLPRESVGYEQAHQELGQMVLDGRMDWRDLSNIYYDIEQKKRAQAEQYGRDTDEGVRALKEAAAISGERDMLIDQNTMTLGEIGAKQQAIGWGLVDAFTGGMEGSNADKFWALADVAGLLHLDDLSRRASVALTRLLKGDKAAELASGLLGMTDPVTGALRKTAQGFDQSAAKYQEQASGELELIKPDVRNVIRSLGVDEGMATRLTDDIVTGLQDAAQNMGGQYDSMVLGYLTMGGFMGETKGATGFIGKCAEVLREANAWPTIINEIGEATKEAYAKYGDQMTDWDRAIAIFTGFANGIIEHYETRLGSGVQSVMMSGHFPGLGEFLASMVTESGEEFKQKFVGDAGANVADWLSGRELTYGKMFSMDAEEKDALINAAEYLDIGKKTMISTALMNVGYGGINTYRSAVDHALNGTATQEEMQMAAEAAQVAMMEMETERQATTVETPTTEEQHDAFEAAAAGGDQTVHNEVDPRAEAELQGAVNNAIDLEDTNVRAAELRMREAQAAETRAIIASGNQNVQAEERARLEQEAREAIARRQAAEAEYRRAQAAASAAVNNQNEQVTTRQQQEQQATDALLEEAAKKELRLRKAQEALERAEAAANQQGQQAKERKEAEKRAGIARRQLQRAQEAYNEAMKAVEDQDRQADERKAAEEAARNDIRQRNDLLQSDLDQTNRNAQDVIFDQDRQVTERAQLEQDARAAEMRLREAQAAETQAIIASGDQSVQAEERARREQEARDAIARRQAAEEEYRRAQEAASAAVQDQKDQATERQEREQKAEEQIEQDQRNDEARTQAGREAAEQAAQAQEDQAAERVEAEDQAKQNRSNAEARNQAAREAAEQAAQAQKDQVAMRREAEKTAEENTAVVAPTDTQAQEEVTGTEVEQPAQQTAQETDQETEQQTAQETAQQPAQETEQEQERRRTADDINRRFGFNQRKEDGDKTKYQPGLTVNTWDGDVNEQTRTELQVIHEYAREHGFAVVMDSTIRPDGVKGVVNGYYSRNEDGGLVIHLAQDGKAPLRTTLGHELYHMISNLNKNGAQRIEKLYRDFAGRQGVDIEALVTKKLEAYRNMGVIAKDDNSARTRAMALEEVIADGMYDVIGDERTLRVLAMEDRGTAERIRDWAERVLRDIRRMIDKYGANKAEARVLQDQADAMENMRAAIERALAETKELQDAKKAAKSLGSNSEMMNDWHRAMDAATTREEMNAATQALAVEVLAKGGIDQNMDNVRTLLTASLEYASGGGVISQVLNEYGMNTWIPSEEANRAFVSMGRYMKQMLESQDEAGYAQLMGWEPEEQIKYSIQTDADGKRYVVVDTDQEQFVGLTWAQIRDKARDIIRYQYKGHVLDKPNVNAYVSSKVQDEYTHPPKRYKDQDILPTKFKAVTELENILNVSEFESHKVPDLEHHPEFPGGWDYYRTRFKVGEIALSGKVNVGIDKYGRRVFYDVTDLQRTTIKEDAEPAKRDQRVETTPATTVSASKDIKTQDDDIVKIDKKFSITREEQKTDQAYQQAVDSGNVEEQQRLVDQAAEEAMPDSKMRDDNGKLKEFYHGTNGDGFTVFDKNLIGTAREGDVGFFGRGFYFAFSKGEAEMYGKNVMPVYLNIKKPFNFEKELLTLNGKHDHLDRASTAVFLTNFANKFPELAKKHRVTVFERGNNEGKDLTLKEFADQFMDVVKNKEFDVQPIETDYGTEWLVTADPVTYTYTDSEGKEQSYKDYDYQERFFSKKDTENVANLAYNYMKNVMYSNIFMPRSVDVIQETDFSDAVQKRGYDGIIQSEDGDEAVVFESSQAKLTDPITYDDAGNVIPLSERFNEQNQDIRYSATQDTEENDHVRYAMDAEDARDMTDLGSDIARTSNVGWQLIDTLRQMKMRQTQDADGNVQRTAGYWKKQTAEIAKSLTEFTFGKDQKTIEKAVRELFTDLDEYEGDARGFVDYALRQAQGTMRDLYTDETENPTRENLKAFFEKYGPLYITPEQKKELQFYAGGMTAFRRQAAGLVPITNKKSAIGLEEVWEELAPLIGKDPSIVSVGTMIMEFNDAVEKARSVNGEERTLTDEEMAVLDRRALDLVAEYMEAGVTVVPTRTVEKIDADRHQQALREVSRLQEETDKQQEEIGRLTRRLEDADNVNQSLNRQLFSRAAELDELKKSNATRAEIDQARTAYREAAAQADEAVKAMKDLQKKLEAARNKRDEYRSQLRKANRAEQQFEKAQHQIERLKAGRENLKKQIEQMKLKAMDARLINRQTKERNQHLNNIRKTGGALRAMFSSPSEKKGYIPMDQVRVAADLVESLVDADKGGNAAKMSKRLENALRDARESTDYQTSTMYDEALYRDMQDVTRLLEDKGSLRNLSGSELAFVDGTLTSIVYQIKTSNETVGRQKNQAIQEEAEDAIRVMRENPKDMNGLGRMIRKGMLTHLNPQRFYAILGHHGSNAWTRMGEEQSEGQRKANMLTMNMTKTFEGLTQGENEKKFDKFTGKNATWYDTGIQILTETGQDSGRTWKMNGAMRSFFGLSWQSEENREAMRAVGEKGDGGKTLYQLTIPDEELMKRGKEKEAYARGERVYFTAEQAEQIIDDLTDYEKAWMNAWKNMEKLSKNAINETSLQLNGFRKANVNNYVPIFRDPRYIGKEFESVVTDARLTSMGFLKERVNANNPMMLMDLTNVINRQVRDVNAYYGFAIPTRNATRIYNGKMPGNATSVKEVINKTQGMEYGQYFEKLMSDLQGGSRVESSFLDRLRGNVAGATLSGNPSVIIKQAASYPAAASVLGWGPLLKGMKYFNPAGLKKINVDEIDQYTSALWERRSRSLSDLEANANRNTAMSKFVHKMANGIQGMDIATTKVIWKAAEYYVDEHSPDLKRGTEAYNNAVARIYEQALEQTQPEYGTMQRPQILRSTNQLVKSLTMYKTQSLQNFGILVDAAYNLSDKAKAAKANNSAENQAALKAAKTQMATAISSQITSAVILGVMTALGKALLHKLSGYRDDKGDLTAESVGGQILKDSVSSVAGMVAGGSELFDMINGLIEGQSPFDIEAAGVSTINDLYQNTYAFLDAMKVLGDSNLSDTQKMSQMWPKLRKLGMSIALLNGIPANNFLNLLDGIAANAADFATGKAGTFASKSPLQIAGTALIGSAQGRETSNKAVAGYIAQAMMDGNQAEAVRLYNEQLRQGKTADALNTAISSWQKENIPQIREAAEAIEWGDLAGYNALINDLVSMGLSMSNAVKYVEAERGKMQKTDDNQETTRRSEPMTYEDIVSGMTKTESDLQYTNGQMNSLLEYGDIEQAKAIRDEMLKAGKKSSSINSSLTSHWKPLLQEAYANGDMEEVRRITNMLVEMGMKRTTITGWTSNTKSTSSSSSKKSGFGSGTFGSGGFGSSSKKSSSKKKSGFGSGSFGSGSFGR